MRPTDNIHKLIKKLNVKAGPELDSRIHDDISKALAEPKQTQPALIQPNIWRIIMKSRITKFVTAAVIIVAVLIGINQFTGSIDLAKPAYGITDVPELFQVARTIFC
jgi:hypothetical protein